MDELTASLGLGAPHLRPSWRSWLDFQMVQQTYCQNWHGERGCADASATTTKPILVLKFAEPSASPNINYHMSQPIFGITYTDTEPNRTLSACETAVVCKLRSWCVLDPCAVDNGGCAHICVTNSSTAAVCLCGDGFKLQNGSTSCRLCTN